MKLIIQGYNKSIHKKNNQILIKEKDKELIRISPKNITDITINSKGYITMDALTTISQNNIPVIAINNQGQIEYIIQTLENQDNITLRQQQYQYTQKTISQETSKEIIISKMKNQYYTLKTLNKNKQNSEIITGIQEIKNNIKQLEKYEINYKEEIYTIRNKIMGYEGKTSATYWNNIKKIIPENINFQKRQQTPKQDITNAMLNYGYAILASEITKEILHQKLDPYMGIIHADLNKRTSLTYDMIEEYRQQIIDKTVLTLINTKQVNEEDIDKRTNTINQETKKLLTENIMKKLHTEITYNNQQITYIQIIEKQIQQLKNTITNNTKYKGFYLRW